MGGCGGAQQYKGIQGKKRKKVEKRKKRANSPTFSVVIIAANKHQGLLNVNGAIEE